MRLRPNQIELERAIYNSWSVPDVRNTMAVFPTGGGKTVVLSKIINDLDSASCVIAHRQELVSQISLALAKFGVKHTIIGPKALIKTIVGFHTMFMGQSFYDPNSIRAVAGVDTLIRRDAQLKHWFPKVGLWVIDEGHHLLEGNKWGRAANLFPNAYGLGMTATPERADGKGLGRHADGIMDDLVVGADMRTVINDGFLTDYRIFAPPSDLNLDGVDISKTTGDFNPHQVKKRMQKAHIVGDVVAHYKKLAMGKLGITFAIDVEEATKIATQFNLAGVPAEVVSAKTPDRLRVEILERLKRREILQVVNVDLFGEGVDIPAIEVCSFARPTESYGLFVQQFGRALRILEGKHFSIIIDHVGNVMRHGLPDAPRVWTLDRREKKSEPTGEQALKICVECTAPYARYLLACPFCGHYDEPSERSKPEFVDGDLMELSPEVLASMRGEQARIDGDPLIPRHLTGIAAAGAKNLHYARQDAQKELRYTIALWAGRQRQLNRSDRESYKLFYLTFGIDVLSAQSLGRPQAQQLMENIQRGLMI